MLQVQQQQVPKRVPKQPEQRQPQEQQVQQEQPQPQEQQVQPERQRQQEPQEQQVQLLLLSCRKRPGQQPAGKRSTMSFSCLFLRNKSNNM